MSAELSAATKALVAIKNGDIRRASVVLAPIVTKLARIASWGWGRKDLSDDLAQEFWLVIDTVVERFDPEKATGEAYITGWLKNICMTMSRKIPVPVDPDLIEEDISASLAEIACFDEKLDRKLAIRAIQSKMTKQGIKLQLSPQPIPLVHIDPSISVIDEEVVENLLAGNRPERLLKKSKKTKNADHIRIKEIRQSLDMTQSEFAAAINLISATLVSYEQGQTQKVPQHVMDRAEELMEREGEILDWRKRFDHCSMIDILNEWAAALGADPADLPSMAALTGTVTSTVSRWRNGDCRPTLREIVAYDRNVKINAGRLKKSGLLVDTKMVRDVQERTKV